MSERVYSVNETFDVLKQYKITSNIESVRRWLRDGTIEGVAPKSRKDGWKVTQTALDDFLTDRLPDFVSSPINATKVVLDEQAIRAAMWHEITGKNIWEGYVQIKQVALKAAAQHRGYSQSLGNEVWERCVANSAAYKKPRVSYLLEAFSFEGERLLLDQSFVSKEEQVIYAIFDYIRGSK